MWTEAEAKTKWCPAARVATRIVTDYYGGESPTGPVANRWTAGPAGPHSHTGQPKLARCLASACMWWRWDGTHINDPDNPKGDLVWSDGTYGHCGIAGAQAPGRADSIEYRRAHPDD